MERLKHWIQAARLRTLPLALSTMIVGHSLAASHGSFRWDIAILSIATAICLQVLSNFSNDYGDSIHGADHDLRTGPVRAVQSGVITSGQMKKAMTFFVLICLIFGITLIYISFVNWVYRIAFLILGIAAIWASINYTAGDSPYGYRGKGDIAVFIFFGLVTVIGSYFLQTKSFDVVILLPAVAAGGLCVAVLNINNIRDIQSDRQAGKASIPVKIGKSAAVRYHGFLIIESVVALIIYGYLNDFGISIKWLFLIPIPILYINMSAVYNHDESYALDPYLKQLALTSSLFLILFSVCLFL